MGNAKQLAPPGLRARYAGDGDDGRVLGEMQGMVSLKENYGGASRMWMASGYLSVCLSICLFVCLSGYSLTHGFWSTQ